MLDYRGVVIYVGKAKNLRKRVKSYFQSPERLDVKTNYLVANIANIETIATRSESDALILEAQLIKEYQPRYNIILKDDKSYPYIKITKELFPRIQVVRERVNDGATYFGPYASVGSTKYLLRMLYDLFPLRDCPQYIDLEDRQPKCLKLDMHKCLGPCVVKTIKSQYDELVDQLKRVLRGRDRQLIADLRQEMTSAADALKFEKAAQIRDRIAKLERLGHR
ncbi:excinuclease ABC subunit C, partial [bacterium]|nr:excinuclease ABC subunit C [bacterium]